MDNHISIQTQLAATLLAIAVLAMITSSAQADVEYFNLGRGDVPINVPASYDGETVVPLVLMLHSRTSTGPQTEAYLRFTPLSEEFGFLYTYPTGMSDQYGPFWNTFGGHGEKPDDSGYLRDIIEYVQNNYVVDANRIYVIGHSNGAEMAHQMACEHSDLVAAIMGLASHIRKGGVCDFSGTVHILMIHGTSDEVIPFEGGCLPPPLNDICFPPVPEASETWAARNGCDLKADTSDPPLDLDASIPGDETTITKYESNCNPGGLSHLWAIQGGRHSPNLTQEFRYEVVWFLLDHPKPHASAELVEFQVVTGMPLDGGLDDLRDSDDSYIHTRSGFGETLIDLHHMEARISAVTTVGSPESLDLSIESRIDEPAGTAQIRLLNYNTQQFDLVGQYALSDTDTIDTILDIDATNYVSAQQEIELRIKHIVFVPFLAYTFESWLDEVRIVPR